MKKSAFHPPQIPPYVSIIIPVYNDASGLRQTLDSLLAQDYTEAPYEIVIVDNNSDDDSPNLARLYESEFPDLIRFQTEEEIQSSYAARNRGIKSAAGTILAFIDSDMTVEKSWLQSAVGYMVEHNSVYLTGAVEIVPNDEKESLVAKFNRLREFPMKMYVERFHFGGAGCIFVKKEIFDKLGRFEQRLISGGDREFGNRVFDAGYRLDYCDEVRYFHPVRSSLRSNLKKAFRVGRGITQLHRYFPQRYGRLWMSIVNPTNVLPPPPWRLRRTIRKWEELGVEEKIVFYFLVWMTKFTGYLGQWMESLHR